VFTHGVFCLSGVVLSARSKLAIDEICEMRWGYCMTLTTHQYEQGPFGDQLSLLNRFNTSTALTLSEAIKGSALSWSAASKALEALLEYNRPLLTLEHRQNFERAGDETAYKLTPFAVGFLAWKETQLPS
jgi:hypothetical protein